jgi:hypothetical protein
MKRYLNLRLVGALALAALALVVGLAAAKNPEPRTKPKLAVSIKPQHVADALRAVVSAEREVYTQVVVHRLQDEEQVIKASARWQEDKALPTPCQMFRLNSEAFASKGVELSYVLRSLQPLNQRNAPETDVERKGLEFVAKHPEQAFYGEELLGGRWYFTAVYPDVAFNPSCVSCHNTQKESPKRDYKLGDVMGGVIVRVALEL